MATKKQSQSGLLSSLLKPDVAEDQDAFKDVLYWMRQVLAVLFGVVWGITPITGGIGIIGFLVLSTAVMMGYYTLVVKVDAEELGGHGTLLQEGLLNSFGVFLVSLTHSPPCCSTQASLRGFSCVLCIFVEVTG
ncbi:unnamed protein product [Closterium sp. NIES-54]